MEVAIHVLSEFIKDLLPNWTFDGVTQRFFKPVAGSFRQHLRVQQKRERRKRLRRSSVPDEDYLFGTRYSRAYESVCRLHRGFVGRQHFDSIVNILKRNGDLPMLFNELRAQIGDIVVENIGPYVKALKVGVKFCLVLLCSVLFCCALFHSLCLVFLCRLTLLPSKKRTCLQLGSGGLHPIKLPPYKLRVGGCYLAMQLHPKEILNYEDLKSQVFQHFREPKHTSPFS